VHGHHPSPASDATSRSAPVDVADFSPLDFSQRHTGTFSDDGNTIAGAWESCHDGKTWEHDFDLIYTKTA
jgi:hypothetical protein